MKQMLVAVGLILLAVLSRWLPHPPNFTPVLSIALFSGALFVGKKWAYLVPLGVLLISDAVIGFAVELWAVYFCFALFVVLGRGLIKEDKVQWGRVVGMSMASSFIFYLVTNAAVWMMNLYYPMTFEGFLMCLAAGLPFYKNTLMSGVLYSAALFAVYSWAIKKVRVLQHQAS